MVMSYLRLALGLLMGSGLAVVACATAGTVTFPEDGGTPPGGDGAAPDGAACPQFDLQTDPKHCGSCTKACALAEVCSLGACKNACDPPTIKCSGGQTCIDVTKDPNNCGTCATVCSGPDSGPDTGTGNPDAGIPVPDGGFDAGTGWTLAASSCDASKCALGCGGGASLCSDNLCWDTQNAHDHCGGCSTACATDVEWCTQGHCCATGKQYCGSACVDIVSDPMNCGGCGKVCPVNTPACVAGACSAQVSVNTVCAKVNPSGILCSGNCGINHVQYADAYCKLAGLTKAVSYTVLTSGTVQCLYYNGGANAVPTMCSQIIGPTSYGLLANVCDAISNLKCQ